MVWLDATSGHATLQFAKSNGGVPMSFKSAKQPLCRYCGKKIPKYTQTYYCYDEEPRREVVNHRTGGVMKVFVPNHIVGRFFSKADVQVATNLIITSVKYSTHEKPKPVYSFSAWDGETYVDQYFCNGEHARNFGYACAALTQDGGPKIAMPAYWDAVEKQKASAA
jgi:hypothetical protein